MITDPNILLIKSQIRLEIERCNDLLEEYARLGPTGHFGHAAISEVIENAVASMVAEDPQQMALWLHKLKGCE